MNDYDKMNYWIEVSEYDLEPAKAMLNTKRYLYVGYMCHQTIEKMLKAVYVRNIKQIPPYIHNLKKLSELSEISSLFSEEQIVILSILEPLNIEGRYPMVKDQIIKMLSEKRCKDLIKNTEELMLWIKNKLKN